MEMSWKYLKVKWTKTDERIENVIWRHAISKTLNYQSVKLCRYSCLEKGTVNPADRRAVDEARIFGCFGWSNRPGRERFDIQNDVAPCLH